MARRDELFARTNVPRRANEFCEERYPTGVTFATNRTASTHSAGAESIRTRPRSVSRCASHTLIGDSHSSCSPDASAARTVGDKSIRVEQRPEPDMGIEQQLHGPKASHSLVVLAGATRSSVMVAVPRMAPSHPRQCLPATAG